MPSILRMFTKRGKDTESKSVYGNKDLGALAGTLASSVTLPDEHGVRLHAYSAQAGNLTAASTTSFLNEPGPSGRAQLSMKPSSSTFHPSLFKLAGRNLSSSATNTTAAAASTPANDSDAFPSTIRRQPVPDDPYPTPSTTPSTIGGPSMDKTSKKGRKKRQKNYSTTTHPSFVQSDDSEQQSPDELSISQSSPPDDSHLSMTQRLEQAAKNARLNAARQALEASTSAEGVQQVPTLDKPLPPGPQPEQPEQPESFPTVAQDLSVDPFPAEVSTNPDPTLLDPTILALEEILRHTLLEQDKLVWDTLEAQLLGPTPEPDIPTQPPPYQDTTPPQEDLPSLRLQLDQHKLRVVSLTKEKLEMVQHQHEKISTVLQQLKQSREETHKIVLEQRRYRVLAESLASENDKLKKERREALQDLDRRSKDSQLLDTANKHMKQEISALQSKLKSREAQNEQLNKEKANWQAQINAMQHSLSDSERRVRCLDQVTRQRFEAKQGGYASVGRSAMLHHSPHVKGPSSDIIGVVASFNDEVFQTSTFLVENLDKVDPQEPAFITPEITTRARQIWGLKIVSMLDMQSKDAMAFNFLLLQNCLEVFITHWCMHIIEGLYPPQASFSDVLVELAAQTAGMASAEKQQICGKQVKIISTESATPEFNPWVNEIIGDLSRILLVGGVKMRSGRSDILPSKLLPLIKIAYDLRLALSEKDICGGLELAAPSPDLPFHPSFMQDAEEHALQGSRKKSTNNPNPEGFEPEFIAGTSALGLKRTLNGQPGVYEMVVKPRVVLIRVLETSS